MNTREIACDLEFNPDHLGTMDDIRAIYRARPIVDVHRGQLVLDKYGLGHAAGVSPLSPYVTNFIHRIDRDSCLSLVLKGQYRPTATWDVSVEVMATRLLRQGTDLPVAGRVLYDADMDTLDPRA